VSRKGWIAVLALAAAGGWLTAVVLGWLVIKLIGG
jgi:hypothetical protein